MSSKLQGEGTKTWLLESGSWSLDSQSKGFILNKTAQGRPMSGALTHEDLRILLAAGHSDDAPNALFPPEFKFNTSTGVALEKLADSVPTTWVPPFGAALASLRGSSAVRGLRQTAEALKLTRQSERNIEDKPNKSLGLPPPGNYQFFSLPACTRAATLLALNPAKGQLYAFLPASKRWEMLESGGVSLLSESIIEQTAWRCEAVIDGLNSLVFLPSHDGLACLRPDALGLRFDVEYIGGAPAIGGAIQFGELVWVPLRVESGVRFVSATTDGKATQVIELPFSSFDETTLGRFYSPLVDGRTALWPTDGGQLLLRKQANGAVVAKFQPWPKNSQPEFEFGSPYLASDGNLWQLCSDTQLGTYFYLQLAVENFERVPTLTPRMCTGSFNFLFTSRFKSEPWLDPEIANEGRPEFVLPLLESKVSSSVLGLRLGKNSSLDAVLSSKDRMSAVLVVDDSSSQIAFHAITVVQPWRLQLFIHDGLLWAYHPQLNAIDGWNLQT